MEFDPYISTEDLEAILGSPLSDPSALIVGIALDSACETVRTYLGQNINLVEDDVEVHSGSGRRKLRLRQRPVRSVTSVVVDEATLTADQYNLRIDTLTMLDADWWDSGDDNITVTYTHGWDVTETAEPQFGVPSDIRLVTLLAARRIYSDVGTSPAGIIAETMGEYSYRLATEAIVSSAVQLMDAEKRALDAYRIELVGSTPTQ